MAFVKRFGGWRPVELEEGVGRLRSAEGELLEGVDYRFEVWHQMVGGFHGPFRSEGRLGGASRPELAPFVGRDVVLELEDGRRLELRLDEEGRLLAHERPDHREELLPESAEPADAEPETNLPGSIPTKTDDGAPA